MADEPEPLDIADTDGVAAVAPEPDPMPPEEDRPPVAPPRVCQVDGCDNLIPADAHGARRYCFEHWTGAGGDHPQRRATARKKAEPKTEPNKLGGPVKRATRPAELAVVEANAKRLIEFAAAGIVIVSRRTEEPMRSLIVADAVDVQTGSDALASGVRGVAQHEAWLRQLLGGGGPISDRALAWVRLLLIAGSISLPILIRHGLLPAEISQMAESLLAQPEPAPDVVNDQPAPAAA